MKRSFRGGIVFPAALQDKKETTQASTFLPISPKRLHLSLRQRNAELEPTVTVGDAVHIGDRLAVDPAGTIPPLHCGISGTVTAIEPSLVTLDGARATVITVTDDGSHTFGSLLPPLPKEPSREMLIQRMYDAGLVGMGGAGFPTYRKYQADTIRHLLINACECEPYLAGDVRLSVEQPDTLAEGVRLLAAAAGIDRRNAVFCTESPAAAAHLSSLGIRVALLHSRYPQGSERQLIAAVFGREVPEGCIPADCGFLVSNVATAVAMAEAAHGLPLTHRSVTVSGKVAHPVNALAPIGTPFSDLIELAVPLLSGRRCRYIAGGPMTGIRIATLAAGLPKTCGGITVLPAQRIEESRCIRCGGCVRVCPAGLMPFRIEAAHLAGEQDSTAAACISCGCCSYVCPAKRNLAAHIGKARCEMRQPL